MLVVGEDALYLHDRSSWRASCQLCLQLVCISETVGKFQRVCWHAEGLSWVYASRNCLTIIVIFTLLEVVTIFTVAFPSSTPERKNTCELLKQQRYLHCFYTIMSHHRHKQRHALTISWWHWNDPFPFWCHRKPTQPKVHPITVCWLWYE